MSELAKGQIVFSKCGRDKGLPFMIVDMAGEYVFLVDGNLRKLDKPKKKKARHIQPTNTTLPEMQKILENKEHLLDAEIRKALVPYKK